MSKTNKIKKEGEYITYIGGCDAIRTSKYNWRQFDGDNKELFIHKKYEVLGLLANQRVYIINEGKLVPDDSQYRYLSYWIQNEFGEKIAVWEGFFEENVNL